MTPANTARFLTPLLTALRAVPPVRLRRPFGDPDRSLLLRATKAEKENRPAVEAALRQHFDTGTWIDLNPLQWELMRYRLIWCIRAVETLEVLPVNPRKGPYDFLHWLSFWAWEQIGVEHWKRDLQCQAQAYEDGRSDFFGA